MCGEDMYGVFASDGEEEEVGSLAGVIFGMRNVFFEWNQEIRAGVKGSRRREEGRM